MIAVVRSCLLVWVVSTTCWSQTARPAFADHLLDGGHDFEAITEYLRFAHSTCDSELRRYAWYRIGVAMARGGDDRQAEQYLEKALDGSTGELAVDVRLALVDLHVRMGYPLSANEAYDGLIASEASTARRSRLHMRKAALALRQMRVDAAVREAETARSLADKEAAPGIERFIEGLRSNRRLPHRSPWLARWMSIALPGSGQVYAGQARGGIRAFLLNGLLAYAAYSSLVDRLYLETGMFYIIVWHRYHVGGAMVAEQAAREYNTAAWNRYTTSVGRPYADAD